MAEQLMDYLEYAAKALQAFSEYAEKLEQETQGKHVPQLKLYSDGSGKIHDVNMMYLKFGDLKDLVDQLKEKK